MAVDLFAGIFVDGYDRALAWYERFLGAPPAFFPNDREAVWKVGEHQYVFVEHRPGHGGHAKLLLFVDDLEARVAALAKRGIEPSNRETYDNGTTKVTYLDAEGNELGFGGTP